MFSHGRKRRKKKKKGKVEEEGNSPRIKGEPMENLKDLCFVLGEKMKQMRGEGEAEIFEPKGEEKREKVV